MSKSKKKFLTVFLTIIGVIALFLIVVFIPIGGGTTSNNTKDNLDIVAENDDTEDSNLSKKELEEKIKELEDENKELKDEVEKYKILAEQTTQAISAPVTSSSVKDKDNKDKDSSKTEFKDSSEYYDKNYKDYTTDDDNDKNNSSSSSNSGSSQTNPSDNNSSNTSDTGL